MGARHRIAVLALGIAALLGLRPDAATAQTLSVGTVTAAQTCTVYREYAGESGAVVTPYVAAGYSTWRSWLVKDCVDNFASLRMSLQAALAGSGGIAVKEGRGRYVVSATLSQVSGGGARPTPDAPDGRKFAISNNSMIVSLDVTVRDPAGRIVFGGLLTKTIEVGSSIKVDGFETSSNSSGQEAYTRLQHEVALAVARMVVFHFNPLRVSPIQGRTASLNYGAPLLTLGMLTQVIGTDGQPIRLRVTAANPGSGTAEIYGDGDFAMLPPGGEATVLEADDPAANVNRYRRVDLP